MYIGLDIGTSGSKADLLDRNGNVLGSGHVSYGFSKTTGGYRELDAEAVWKAAIKCLYDAAAEKHVESITVSALGEAIVPIDREGNPVGPGIIGTDIRGIEELKEILKLSKENKIPLTIIGNGSNILVTDKGIRGITAKLNFKNIKIENIANKWEATKA